MRVDWCVSSWFRIKNALFPNGGGALAKEETARVVQQRTMDNEA